MSFPVLSSEWLKIRSIRSTYYIAGVVVVGALGAVAVAAQAAAIWDELLPESRRGDYNTILIQAITVPIVQLGMAVLGIFAITSEYANATIRASFAAVPRRVVVLGGKAAVVATTAAVAGLVTVPGAFYASGAVLDGLPVLPGSVPPASEQVPLVLALGVSASLFALVGLGLGAVLRSTVGAICAVVAQWYVLPMITQWLPEPWNDRVASVLLPNVAPQLVGETAIGFGATGVLPPWGAAAVTAGYVALAIGAAVLAIIRRDA